MKEIVDAMKKSLKSRSTASSSLVHPLFSDKRYKPIPLTENNFHPILKDKSDSDLEKKGLTFIDGGNAEVFGSPDVSFQFIRVYGVVYRNQKRYLTKKIEMFSLVTAERMESNLAYKAKFFPIHLDESDPLTLFSKDESIVFNSLDRSISDGMHRAKISKVGEAMRRFAEIRLASELTQELSENDAIILDGTLNAGVTHESIELDRLYSLAAKKGINVCGLAKTCSLFADNGDQLQYAISSLAPDGIWSYHPLAEIDNPEHKAKMHFIKLESNSDYVFRLDTSNNIDEKQLNDLLVCLSYNSKDPVFKGYPYGLLDADKFARVSNRELDIFRTKFRFTAGNDWAMFRKLLAGRDAHDILDNI